MASQTLVVHERIGNWGRHLRPRVVGWPVRLVETRSASDLEAAVAGVPCPIVVVDLARRPRPALEDLDRALGVAPDALALVLNPQAFDGVSVLARELGATHVIDGPATPPAVAGLLARWLPLAHRRAEAAGRPWAPLPAGDSEPWAWFAPDLLAPAGPERPSRE